MNIVGVLAEPRNCTDHPPKRVHDKKRDAKGGAHIDPKYETDHPQQRVHGEKHEALDGVQDSHRYDQIYDEHMQRLHCAPHVLRVIRYRFLRESKGGPCRPTFC